MPLPLDAPVTILVIDDKPSIVSGLARLLRRDGHTVATAENGGGVSDLLISP
jgi:CheY-like chemotaxis protein